MDEIESALSELGITGNKAKVYLSILRLKSATGGEIARDSKVERRNCYDALQSLMERGLVTYITRNNVKYFQACDVHNLVEELEEKKRILDSVLPSLRSMEEKRMMEDVSVYHGMNGLKMILKGALEFAEGSEIVGFGDTGRIGTEMIPDFMRIWHAKRIKKGIRLRTIFNNDPETIQRMKKAGRIGMRKARIMPIPFTSHLGIWICKDRSILWFLSEDPMVIMIRNREISEEFRKFFEILWEKAGEKEKKK